MDQLINRSHQQLIQIKSRLFETLLAREVALYTPDTVNNVPVYQDEDDFEEADVVGCVVSERMPLAYSLQGTIKLIEVRPSSKGRFAVVGRCDGEKNKRFCFEEQSSSKRSTVVRDNELNEFEQNQWFYFITQGNPIPIQAVIQFQVFSSPDESLSQTIQLIKVDERSIGKPAFANQVHTFSNFHGVIV